MATLTIVGRGLLAAGVSVLCMTGRSLASPRVTESGTAASACPATGISGAHASASDAQQVAAGKASAGGTSVPGGEGQVRRVFLAELFGADWCPYCQPAHAALERLQGETGDSLLVLEYHTTDDYGSAEARERAQDLYEEGSIPLVQFNGGRRTAVGAGNEEDAYFKYRYHFDQERIAPVVKTDFELAAQYEIVDRRVGVTARLKNTGGLYEDITVNFVVFEDLGPGHKFLVRDILPDTTIQESNNGDSHRVESVSDPLTVQDVSKVGVVVFLQLELAPEKDVLQATRALRSGEGLITAKLACPEILDTGKSYAIPLTLDMTGVGELVAAVTCSVLWDGSLLEWVPQNGVQQQGQWEWVTSEAQSGPGDDQGIMLAAWNQLGEGGLVTLARLEYQVIGQEGEQGEITLRFLDAYAPVGPDTIVDLRPRLRVEPCRFSIGTPYCRGDVVGDDGRVTIRDVLVAATYVVDSLAVPDWARVRSAGDWNGDGKVTGLDVWEIAKAVVAAPKPAIVPEMAVKPAVAPFVMSRGGGEVRAVIEPSPEACAYLVRVAWPPEKAELEGVYPHPLTHTSGPGYLAFVSVSPTGTGATEVLWLTDGPVDEHVFSFHAEAIGRDLSPARLQVLLAREEVVSPVLRGYPNPFNSLTSIPFAIPADGHVRLVVYDLLGRKVRVLVDDLLSAGEHTVTWNGRDQDGRPAGSGVYVCQLEAPSTRQSCRLVLVK